MTGRPSIFTEDLAATICARISEGESLRSVCRDEEMPGLTTVMRWIGEAATDPEKMRFREQYDAARESRADAMFEDMLEISDDARNDWMEKNGQDNPGFLLNGEHVSRSKLRVDTRKWMLGRMSPKRYGDKQAIEHSGPNGEPIKTENVATDAKEMARRIAFLLAQGIESD